MVTFVIFFVDSVSDDKMYVIYVTSPQMSKKWGAIVEVGANWITQMNHKVFNIDDFRPEHPLDDETQWHQSTRTEDGIGTSKVSMDIFLQKNRDNMSRFRVSCEQERNQFGQIENNGN